MILIVLRGIPVPWMAHGGYGRRSFNPRFREKDYAVHHIRLQYTQEPVKHSVSITYEFHMPIPKSTSTKKKVQMLSQVIEHTKRPDCTNLTKFIEDCLKGIVIEDDSLVVESIARKKYSEDPRTVITIKPITRLSYGGIRTSL